MGSTLEQATCATLGEYRPCVCMRACTRVRACVCVCVCVSCRRSRDSTACNEKAHHLRITFYGSKIIIIVCIIIKSEGNVPSLPFYQPLLSVCLSRDDDKPQACFLCLVDVPKAVTRLGKQVLIVLLCSGRPSLELYPTYVRTYVCAI